MGTLVDAVEKGYLFGKLGDTREKDDHAGIDDNRHSVYEPMTETRFLRGSPVLSWPVFSRFTALALPLTRGPSSRHI